MGEVRLDCPLCGAVVSDGPATVPGRCPGCGARYEGGGGRPHDAAARALKALGIADGDGDHLARALFDADEAGRGIAITSDRRDGFYAWWVFVADDPDAVALLAERARGEEDLAGGEHSAPGD